jgi:hypothetical protein
LGTNGLVGAQNNIFLDTPTNSRTANTITRYGNVTQGTFTPYSKEAGKWSNYFDGSSYLSIPHSTVQNLAGVDFTISFDCFVTSFSRVFEVLAKYVGGSLEYVITINTNGSISLGQYPRTVSDITTPANLVKLNTFTAVSIVKSGASITAYVNGVPYSLGNYTLNHTTTNPLYIGVNVGGNPDFQGVYGYISNLKITKAGVTVLDTCKDNRFKDNSIYNHVLTPTGNVKVSPFSPYANSVGYDAMAYGGSGYFDGSGDYLSAPSSASFAFGTSDFSIKFSFFYNGAADVGLLAVNESSSGINLLVGATGYIRAYTGYSSTSNIVDSTSKPISNAWNDVEVTRTSGTLSFTLNGVLCGSHNWSTVNAGAGTGTLSIGSAYNNGRFVTGYISNLRITKAGTEVLNLKFANAGIRDESGMNNIETVGDAKVSSDGQGVVFDGSGDYLVSTTPSLGTGDFSVEFDIYTTTTANQYLISLGTTDDWAGAGGVAAIFYQGTLAVAFNGTAVNGNVSGFVPTQFVNGWHKLKLYRTNGVCYTSLNGMVSPYTMASTADFNGTKLRIGHGAAGHWASLSGTIKNLTITKGA